MKVFIKWLMSGNLTEFEESDELLHPGTSILELKGLIQISYGYSAKELLLAANKHLLENHSRLKDCGIVDAESAKDIYITAHVVPAAAPMEKSNLTNAEVEADDDDEDDTDIQEFSHEDMILAMKMLGKDIPISGARLKELREHAPRAAPQYLNLAAKREPSWAGGQGRGGPIETPKPHTQAYIKAGETSEEPAKKEEEEVEEPAKVVKHADGSHPRLVEIFQHMEHGLRQDDVDVQMQIVLPQPKTPEELAHSTVPTEPYTYWDLRLPADMTLMQQCGPGELAMEIFYFGEIDPILKPGPYGLKGGTAKFQALVEANLASHGFQVKCVSAPREAGCMYPLVAVPIQLSVVDCWELGHRVFEKFGSAVKSQAHTSSTKFEPSSTGLDSSTGAKPGQPAAACSVM